MRNISEIRRQVLALATSLALQTTGEQGIDYTQAISAALDEACLRLSIDKKQFIKLFVR